MFNGLIYKHIYMYIYIYVFGGIWINTMRIIKFEVVQYPYKYYILECAGKSKSLNMFDLRNHYQQ